MTRESNKDWNINDLNISRGTSIIDTILKTRGVTDDLKSEFLSPTFASIPNYTFLHNSAAAAEQIVEAAKQGKKIFVHGDFDVDGVCATAIMWEFLYKDLARLIDRDVNVFPYIPDRVDEGYGLTERSVDAMLSQGAQVIISVDCGVRDKELIHKYMAGRSGSDKVEFIITDHHQPPENFLEGLDYTVVHQMFPGKEYPYEKICGAVIALLLVQAMKAYCQVDYELSLETRGLDLAALATVADMMPLVSVNRAIVKFGLEQMSYGRRIGLVELCNIAGVKISDVDSYHLGYVIGPRLNAAGRIGSATDALKLLLTSDSKNALSLARKVNDLNLIRQLLTEKLVVSAREQIATLIEEKGSLPVNLVYGEDWSEGIIGLVASKLLEETGRPSIVVTSTDSGVRGSARSISSFNITDAISKFSHYLERYGGHVQAAGFTVNEGHFDSFRKEFIEYASSIIAQDTLRSVLDIDSVIDTDDLNLRFINELETLRPYGFGNKKPLLMIPQIVVVDKKVMGKSGNHLKLVVKGGGIGLSEMIMFDCAEDVDKITRDSVLDVAGNLGVNEWNGNTSPQFEVKEWRRQKLKT